MNEISSKINQKTIIVILVGVIVILVGVVLWQLGGNKSENINEGDTETATTTETIATTTAKTPTTMTKPKSTYVAPVAKSGYVSLSYKTPKEAVFILSTPVIDADVNGNHVDYCLFISGQSDVNDYCEDTAYGSGFKVSYSPNTGVVRITDTTDSSKRKQDLSKGAFLPTCSGCTVSVRFHDIRNEAGTVLSAVQIPVTIK
jgi:hypothetical protein